MLRIYSFNSMNNNGTCSKRSDVNGTNLVAANLPAIKTLPAVAGGSREYFKNYDRFMVSSSASLAYEEDEYARARAREHRPSLPLSTLSMSTCSSSYSYSYSSINRSNSFILTGNTTNDSNRHVSVHASATSTINRQTSCVGSLINNTNGSSSHNVSATNSFRRRIDPSLKNPQKIVLDWCQARTKNYTNVKITNFSSSWADGLAFCALIHSFMPDSFDYNQLSGQNRKHNFELAFNVAQKRANIEPLLEVSDMLLMGNRPDEKCIYTYLSTIYSRFCSIKSNATSSVNTSNPSRQP